MGREKKEMHDHGPPDDPASPVSQLIGGALQLNPDLARAASPITYVHAHAPPMLLQYSDADRLVPFAQGQALYDALKAQSCDVTLQCIAGADHCFWGVENSYIDDDDISFFKRHLG